MKICIKAHHVPTFGDIPEGSLWDDDSPFVLDENAGCFGEVLEAKPEPAVKRPSVRKFQPKSKSIPSEEG